MFRVVFAAHIFKTRIPGLLFVVFQFSRSVFWTMGLKSADLSTAPDVCWCLCWEQREKRKEKMQKPTRFVLMIRVQHHSPLAAWSLSSLPLDFPLMESRNRSAAAAAAGESNFSWSQFSLSLSHPLLVHTVRPTLALPLSLSPSLPPSLSLSLSLSLTTNRHERSQACARTNDTRTRAMRDKRQLTLKYLTHD